MERIFKEGLMLQNVKIYTILDYLYFFGIFFGMFVKEIEEIYF